jgi:protein-S-isoprenylcysteine O-methyltransferase Ste14
MFDTYYAPANLFAMGIVFLCWIELAIVTLTSRRANKGKTPGKAKRDNRSILGVALQGAAVGLVWVGPIRAEGGLTGASILAGLPAAAVGILSVALFIWSARTMGANWALVARTRDDHRLVETGPFAIMRNPIYVALFGLMAATALAFGHAVMLAFAMPVYVAGTLVRVLIEEKLLRATFGAAYDDYAKRVKRFIPHVI